MKCRICNQQTKQIFKSKILNKYNINYYYCGYCGFLQTEEPYWLEEAYKNPISISDTGILQRNIVISNWLATLLSIMFNRNGKFLDYAGGYGILVRLMRDIGFDFYWYDKYSPNLFAKGFEAEMRDGYEALTAIECFEHFVNPIEEIENMLQLSKNLIFTTELLPNPIPKPDDWWFYGLDHGQHISFYSKKTFEYIAKTYNLNYTNIGKYHLLTDKKISAFKIKVIKIFSRFRLHVLLLKQLKGKTWKDHCILVHRKDQNV
jgi:hypothetical protein